MLYASFANRNPISITVKFPTVLRLLLVCHDVHVVLLHTSWFSSMKIAVVSWSLVKELPCYSFWSTYPCKTSLTRHQQFQIRENSLHDKLTVQLCTFSTILTQSRLRTSATSQTGLTVDGVCWSWIERQLSHKYRATVCLTLLVLDIKVVGHFRPRW